ncbi:N-acetylglucosamine-1-phosphodiester alpha-N-acetylglucosaminidase isoform X2 [Hyla sarda]|uniref:N-acetylglucosamine-1-phosphodiester alpha-N-acetylglucosaminidase isoform X2 n=1 Tax=Hyla sarda TaxID=327740 RepID=UPI0024C3A2FE|nr:N-acetylglucosamine-1-phosphodiester alpha-N-acetylglucosaminidase isoform X2 [Hyla sarda]
MSAPWRRGEGLLLSHPCPRYLPARYRSGHRGRALQFALLVHCWLHVSARTSMEDDLLQPYDVSSKHGPSRSNRETRSCLPLTHGNTTHEVWPSNNDSIHPVATTRMFISILGDEVKKTVRGHFTFVNNPLRTLSVLEPGQPGACGRNITETVEDTVKYGKCIVAQNGGFFNTETKQCLGNIVSNGRLVQNSRGIQNAQFGIKADGTMVFGYLSEEEVLSTENPFVQLVSGVVWLLRNGKVYIEESKKVECEDTQNTGRFDHFVNVISARTAIGHDKDGQLILFHVDGQTKDRGVFDPMWRCPRSVSTIVCVHEPLCNPPDCGSHGKCVAGECHCTGYWMGSSCEVLSCGPSNCSAHGTCTPGGCVCDVGWMDSNCSSACSHGYYGDGCTSVCRCQNNGTCDHINGTCKCPAGFTGLYCEEVCPFGYYGLGCQDVCQCEKQCYCHPATGSCNFSKKLRTVALLSKVGSCMESVLYSSWWEAVPSDAKVTYLAEHIWVGLSCTLLGLLVISIVFNIRQVWSCRRNSKDWTYSYQQLREMNGNVDVPDMYETCDLYHPDIDVDMSHNEMGSGRSG